MELTEKCQEAFERIKDMLMSGIFFTHFDPKVELILASDTSKVGIGAVLLQKDKLGSIKVVVPVSRGLITAEKDFSQIEKEGFFRIFGIKKLHIFIHG